MSAAPAISAEMIERAIGEPSRTLHAYITDQLGRAGDKLHGLVDDALEHAYICGQKDGWTRGLGAAIAGQGIAGDGERGDDGAAA